MTRKTKGLKGLTNRDDFKLMLRSGRPRSATIAYLLTCEGYTAERVAKEAGVASATARKTIAGTRKNESARQVIRDVLGFDPWGTP